MGVQTVFAEMHFNAPSWTQRPGWQSPTRWDKGRHTPPVLHSFTIGLISTKPLSVLLVLLPPERCHCLCDILPIRPPPSHFECPFSYLVWEVWSCSESCCVNRFFRIIHKHDTLTLSNLQAPSACNSDFCEFLPERHGNARRQV